MFWSKYAHLISFFLFVRACFSRCRRSMECGKLRITISNDEVCSFTVKVTEWYFFLYFASFYDFVERYLLFHKSRILSSPCWWTYLCILAWSRRIYRSFRDCDHFYCNPILYVIINRHDWSAIRVDMWPMASTTWTIYAYSGLGTISASVAVDALSWYNILWPVHVIANESHMVPFMTLQQVDGNDKGT